MNSEALNPALMSTDDLQLARQLAQQGQIAQAEAAYLRILAVAPEEVEALNFTAMCEVARGQPARAIPLLEQAKAIQPDNDETLKNLGASYRAIGNLDAALNALQRAVQIAPDYFVARLHLGVVLQQLGRTQDAVITYTRAINSAQKEGFWLSEASTPPGLSILVKNAMRYAWAGRRNWFFDVLSTLRSRYGSDALRRVDACLAGIVGDTPIQYPDARQKPTFLYFPELPTTPYFKKTLFPWIAAFEQQTKAICDELFTLLVSDENFEPFLKFHTPSSAAAYLGGSGAAAAWNAFFFYRHGEHFKENCLRCPLTSSVLEALPLVRIREHAPEICFSVLTPGSHILPHRGVTNTRVVAHLPLIVPTDCALSVGGELHVWKEGECMVFDDTYEHEAWNRSQQIRVILLMDTWNPYLTEVERMAVTDVVAAIGDFNRQVEIS